MRWKLATGMRGLARDCTSLSVLSACCWAPPRTCHLMQIFPVRLPRPFKSLRFSNTHSPLSPTAYIPHSGVDGHQIGSGGNDRFGNQPLARS